MKHLSFSHDAPLSGFVHSGDATGNKKLSTKAWVLKLLREAKGSVLSGEVIATLAGCSRVAVWKAAESLREAGYAIESCGKEGYRLLPHGQKDPSTVSTSVPEDFLYPWEFEELEEEVLYYKETDSTMNRARELAIRAIPGSAIIVAESQQQSKAREPGSWHAAAGGLFCTILEWPALPVSLYHHLIQGALKALRQAIFDEVGIQAVVQEPNHLMAQGKKLAGLFWEFFAELDQITWFSLGVGVHLNEPDIGPEEISCYQLTGRFYSRRNLLLRFLRYYRQTKQEGGIYGRNERTVGTTGTL
ncbi:MAG: HTH domain-containing protein [Treponemataceae bacterium]|nr:HTH domain-containing protein [Treponemataceae bacterium]